MENKQTAMKVLMEWMIEESQVIPVDPGDVYQKAKELLAMEKEQIKDAWLCGQTNGATICTPDAYEPKEKYYNETYKQQDNG
jgi:hypothetical protein